MSLVTLLGLIDSTQLAQRDLTTVDNVRAFLQTPGTDTEQDQIIATLITRASALIEHWASREFAPYPDLISRTFTYDGNGRLDLTPFDLRAIDNILDYADRDISQQLTLTATTDYQLQPPTPLNGTYRSITMLQGADTQRWVTVTGLWGMPTVPADVTHACDITVAQWVKRDVSGFTRTYGADEATANRPISLPYAAQDILSLYRTPTIA